MVLSLTVLATFMALAISSLMLGTGTIETETFVG